MRIPAAMCGIYSLKPVDLRLSYVHLSSDAHWARKLDLKMSHRCGHLSSKIIVRMVICLIFFYHCGH